MNVYACMCLHKGFVCQGAVSMCVKRKTHECCRRLHSYLEKTVLPMATLEGSIGLNDFRFLN